MRKHWLTALLALAVAGLSLGLAACGDEDDGDGAEITPEITAEVEIAGGAEPEFVEGNSVPGGDAKLDLVIGDIIPLSGDLSDFGPPGEKAADLAVDEINAAIEEAGVDHTVEILHEDEQTEPQATVQAGRKLVGEGASCFTGAFASSDSIPLAESVSIPEGILQISPASTSPELTDVDDNGLLNRTAPPDTYQAPTLADAVAEDLGGAEGVTVNVGSRNDSYGEAFSDEFTKAWEDLGGTVGETVLYDPKQPSLDSEAEQLTSGEPEALIVIDFPETFVKFGPALARTGAYDPTTTWATDGLKSESLGEDIDAEVIEGMRGTAPGAPDSGAGEAFDAAFQDADPTDVERQTFDAQVFDAVMLCYLSAVAAGSTDGQEMADVVQQISAPGGTEYSWEQLPEAIEALQNGEDIDYTGATGAVDMDVNGDATTGVYDIYEFSSGG